MGSLKTYFSKQFLPSRISNRRGYCRRPRTTASVRLARGDGSAAHVDRTVIISIGNSMRRGRLPRRCAVSTRVSRALYGPCSSRPDRVGAGRIVPSRAATGAAAARPPPEKGTAIRRRGPFIHRDGLTGCPEGIIVIIAIIIIINIVIVVI